MTTIGYARVSTTDQNLEIQVAALKAAGAMSFGLRSEAAHRQQAAPSFGPFSIFSAKVTA